MYATYTELKDAHQKEMNDFPLGFAFSDKQFIEIMKKWGLCKGDAPTKEELQQIVSIGVGGFMKKSDVADFKKMCDRHRAEEREFQKSEKNLIDEIYYEMCNHEYFINWDGDADVLEAIGRTEEDLENDEHLSRCYKKAKAKYMHDAEVNDCF